MTTHENPEHDGRRAPLGCPICGQVAVKRLFHKDSYAVMSCRDCQVEFLHPQPDQDTLVKIYSSQYFIGAGDFSMSARVSEMKRRTAALYLDRIGALKTTTSPAMLEIGCGNGDLLFEAQRRGYRVAGVEFSPFAVAKANARLGAELVQPGSVEDADLPSRHFDFVIAADVLEHVSDPKRFLERIRELMCLGGAVILITPSLESMTRRVMRWRWMEYKVEHLFYFGRHSIHILLTRCGFSDIVVRPNKKLLSIEYVHQHFEKFPVPLVTPLLSALNSLLPRSFTHRCYEVAASSMFVVAYKRS